MSIAVLEPSDASNLKPSTSIDPSRDQKLYPTSRFLRTGPYVGIAETRYILDFGVRLRGWFPKLLRQSSRELSRRRPSLETQSLDNYQRESMAGYIRRDNVRVL